MFQKYFYSILRHFLYCSLMLMATMIGVQHSNAASNQGVVKVPDGFFGMHIRWGATSTPWPFVRFQSWRVITQETEWRGLQPQRDVWNFEFLDRAVALSEEHGVDVILTLGQTPTWASARPFEIVPNGPGASAEPANISDWDNYVRVVIKRYKGRIKYYELWNEPYFTEVYGKTGRGHFTGSAVSMVQLGRSVRVALDELDPNAKLISPSCVSRPECLDAFLSAGGSKIIDIVGYHFYLLPERIPQVANQLRSIMRKYDVETLPIWNTESGYLVNGTDKLTQAQKNLGEAFAFVLTPEMLPGYVLRSMVFAALSGVSRYYHFSWDIPTMHLMWKKGTEPTPASAGYAQAVRWLRGATLGNLKNELGIVSCDVTSRSGHKGVLVWSVTGVKKYAIPNSLSIAGYETIGGVYIANPDAKNIDVSESPILIRQEAALW